MANKINPISRDTKGETSPYVIDEWHPVQMRTPNGLSLKQNGHFTVSLFILTPFFSIGS